MVNDINCTYAWRCPKKNIIKNYKSNIKNNHLEIGPGTGYFLKNNFDIKKLYLIDINQDTLDFSYQNLSENYNDINIINHNLFEEKLFINNLESAGINYVLHCVPGNLEDKIDNLVNNLKSNKQITYFGATVLNDEDLQTNVSRLELQFLNKFKIFNNKNDYSKNLINFLKYNNFNYKIKIVGNVLIFSFII